MKILVMSDSHSGKSFMKHCVERLKPDVMIHLGDHFEDGTDLGELFPRIPLHQVPGNCDRYRMVAWHPEVLCYTICGVKLYMTHGHNHKVKTGLYALLRDARTSGAHAVLYGHTHCADCHQEPDGLWVLNPGSCGSYSGSVGLIETQQGNILNCRIYRQADLEEMV